MVEMLVPPGVILNGENNITFEAPLDSGITLDMLYINWFEIQYPRTFQASNNRLVFTTSPGEFIYRVTNFSAPEIEIFDITDPLAPLRVSGGAVAPDGSTYGVSFAPPATGEARRYLVQTISRRAAPLSIAAARSGSQLRSAANGADYIVITPDEFLPAANELAAYRAGQGLRVKVVTLPDIHDQFAFGYPHPEAVQAFLAYAFTNWQPPAPLYVVLLGDGHYDYKNLTQRNEPNWMPPLLADVDPWIGETAVDNRFAAVHGSDYLPDLYIGRLPAKSLAHANDMVQKIKQYEAGATADWNRQALFVADNTDSGGNFAESNDHLAALLPPFITVKKLNFINSTVTPTSSFRAAVQAEINAGKGILLYSGHGSQQFWASEGLFQRSYIPNLTPTGMYPFMISLTCMDGYFISLPQPNGNEVSSLAEGMVRAADRGAIAAFSPAGYGVVAGHEILASGLFEAIYRHGMQRAGAVTTYAKVYLAANTTSHREIIDNYTLFGDPALRLKLAPEQPPAAADLSLQLRQLNSAASPGDWVDVQVDYANLGAVPAEGITLQLPVPAELVNPSVTAAPVLAQNTGAPYTFLLPVLNAGRSGRVFLRAQIDPENDGIFLLQASIASASPDADPSNNSAVLPLGEAPPTDLSVQVSLLPDSALYGSGWAEVSITYANLGAKAAAVSLSLPLSEPFSQPVFTLPDGWTEQHGQPVSWGISSLPAGAYGQIRGRVQIDALASGGLAFTAQISSYTPDTDPSNNQFILPFMLSYRQFLPVVRAGP